MGADMQFLFSLKSNFFSLRQFVKYAKKFSSGFLAVLFILGMSACQEPEKETLLDNGNLTQQQKDEQKWIAEQERQKRNARFRKVLVEHVKIQIPFLSETQLVTRIEIRLNKILRPMIINIPIDTAVDEQIFYLDKTAELGNQFPGNLFQVETFRFKSGTLKLMGLEYRFMRTRNNEIDSASLYILFSLDQINGNIAILKSEFPFPSKNLSIRTWAKNAQLSISETR
jgi:hypothetical protein